jgi:hypothetical protein
MAAVEVHQLEIERLQSVLVDIKCLAGA